MRFLCAGRKWLVFSVGIDFPLLFCGWNWLDFSVGDRTWLDLSVGMKFIWLGCGWSNWIWFQCRDRNWLSFCAAVEINFDYVLFSTSSHDFFLCRGWNYLGFVTRHRNMRVGMDNDLILMRGSKLKWFWGGRWKLTWFQCGYRNWLFCAGGRNWFCCIRADSRLVFMFGSRLTWC